MKALQGGCAVARRLNGRLQPTAMFYEAVANDGGAPWSTHHHPPEPTQSHWHSHGSESTLAAFLALIRVFISLDLEHSH